MKDNILLVAVAAFAGGILASLLGFLDSGQPFDVRKFGKSLIFALLSGIGFAVSFTYSDSVSVRDLALAVLGGAGVDSLSNRVIGAVKGRSSAPPSPSGR